MDHKAKNGIDLLTLCQNMGPVFMSKREEAVDSSKFCVTFFSHLCVVVTDMQKTQTILKVLIEQRFILKFKVGICGI